MYIYVISKNLFTVNFTYIILIKIFESEYLCDILNHSQGGV